MRQTVTIRDVAEQAGVAVSTASMALRNHPRISLKTRTRIRETADLLGYRPNPMIAALMANLRSTRQSHDSPVIALLHAHPEPESRRSSPYYTEILKGAVTQAETLGYRIEEFWAESQGMNDQRISDILYARGITGVLIAPSHLPRRHWQLNWDSIAAVTLGYTMEEPLLHRACAHHFQGMCMLFDKAQALGYKRIGLVQNQDLDDRVHHQFRAAYLLKQQQLARKHHLPVLLQTQPSPDAFQQWFQRHQPDCVLGGYDVFESLKHVQAAHCGFATLDWNHNYAPCAGIQQQSRLISAAAIDLIVEMLHKNERGIPVAPKTIMIESTWMPGDTLQNNTARDARYPKESSLP